MNNPATEAFQHLNINAEPLIPQNCHFFIRHAPEKEEKYYFTNLHSYHMLWFCLSGQGCVCIEQSPYILNAGEAIILSPEQAHFRMPYQNKEVTWLIIRFKLRHEPHWLTLMHNQLFKIDEKIENLLKDFRSSCDSFHNDGQASANECLLRLALILDAIRITAGKLPDNSGSDERDMIKKLCSQLIRSVSGSKTLTEIARENGVSPGHLRALVKKEIGRSPQRVKIEEILRRAETLLTHSSLNISEISFRLKFSSIYAFSRFFKKHRGISPLQFRKNPVIK